MNNENGQVRFFNPNTDQATIDHLIKLFIEANHSIFEEKLHNMSFSDNNKDHYDLTHNEIEVNK